MAYLVNIFDKWHRRRNVYNLMQTCRDLYNTGLPCLYSEVLIDDVADSSSFFLALPERGHLVRRLRIDERPRRPDDKRKVHDETFIPESLAVITQYCSNLRELFVGCRCLSCVDGYEEEADLEWFVGLNQWVQEIVLKSPMLELLVTPVLYNPELFFAKFDTETLDTPVANLTRLYLSKSNYLSRHLVDVAKTCKMLREVYLSHARDVCIADFLEFLRLVPDLEILHVIAMTFGSDNGNRPSRDSDHIGAILDALPSTSQQLRTLFLDHVSLPTIFPAITTESFPKLRVLGLDHQPASHKIQNLLSFLQNIRSLEILHIDCRTLQLSNSTELVSDVLSPRVAVYTPQNALSSKSPIAEAVGAGKLKYSTSWLRQNWAGIEADAFVTNWTFNVFENGDVSEEELSDDDTNEETTDNDTDSKN